MKVLIELTHPEAKIPVKGHKTDACYDVTAVDIQDHGFGKYQYSLGIITEIDFRSFRVHPRSSIHKRWMSLANSEGVIDRDFRGIWQVFMYHHPIMIKEIIGLCGYDTFNFDLSYFGEPYKIGDKIGQIEIPAYDDEIEWVEINPWVSTEEVEHDTGLSRDDEGFRLAAEQQGYAFVDEFGEFKFITDRQFTHTERGTGGFGSTGK